MSFIRMLQTIAGINKEIRDLRENAGRDDLRHIALPSATNQEGPADAFGGEGPSDAFHGAAPPRPGLRTLQLGMAGSGARAAETAKRVVEEARNTAKTLEAAAKKLDEIWGDSQFFDETTRELLAKVAEMGTGYYSGAEIMRRILAVLNGMDKGQGPGAEYALQDRMGDLVEVLQTYMGREGQKLTEQSFYGYRNRRNRRRRFYGARSNSAQSGRSTGVNP
jgi:hypothetical protein